MPLVVNGVTIPQNVANALMVNGVNITQVIANGVAVWTQSLEPVIAGWTGNMFQTGPAYGTRGLQVSGLNCRAYSEGAYVGAWIVSSANGILQSGVSLDESGLRMEFIGPNLIKSNYSSGYVVYDRYTQAFTGGSTSPYVAYGQTWQVGLYTSGGALAYRDPSWRNVSYTWAFLR
jgi:hypothetical protein